MTRMRLDAGEEVRISGAKPRVEGERTAQSEIVALKRFKKLMKENAGKLRFSGEKLRNRR
ncbi:MAG: hypothetical protein ABI383_14750 [Acidobacteriaceae bacterium]